uniref:Uncharacterized protein n=1 Tax=Plectus sambesii TaxID=2011161 RepID=A0A914V493_9BILA
MDVWMGVAMTFVFAAMIEFTVAHNRPRNQAKFAQKADGDVDDQQLTEEQKTQCRILDRIFVQPEQSILLRNKLLSTENLPIRKGRTKTMSNDNRNASGIKIREIMEDASKATDEILKDPDADVIWDQSCSCTSDRANVCSIVIQESPYVKMINSYKRFHKAKENFGLPKNADIQILNFYKDIDRERKKCCPIESYLRLAARLDSEASSASRATTTTTTTTAMPANLIAADIDEKSRIAFPIVFIVFNIIYWGYYLYLV